MWKNVVERDRPQMTVWRMRIACWITKATNTHSEYVILIDCHYNNGYKNVLQCYVMRTLAVLFINQRNLLSLEFIKGKVIPLQARCGPEGEAVLFHDRSTRRG